MKNNNNYKTQKMEIKEQKKIFEKQMKEEKINLKRERQIENAQNRGLVNRVKLFARRFWIKFSKSKIGNKINEFIYWLMKRIEKSIRFELMVVFAVCFAISVIFYGISNNILSRDYTSSSIKYDYETIKDKALQPSK